MNKYDSCMNELANKFLVLVILFGVFLSVICFFSAHGQENTYIIRPICE